MTDDIAPLSPDPQPRAMEKSILSGIEGKPHDEVIHDVAMANVETVFGDGLESVPFIAADRGFVLPVDAKIEIGN